MSLADRFWAKVIADPDTGCWEWLGSRAPAGYGRIAPDDRTESPLYAHRVSYELVVGPIPAGLTIDHLCRNRGCCNPAHLEPVTGRENWLRGTSQSAKQSRQTHCIRGHALSGDNLYVARRGSRACRACARIRDRDRPVKP